MMDTEKLLLRFIRKIESLTFRYADPTCTDDGESIVECIFAACTEMREACGLTDTDDTDKDDGQLALFDVDTLSPPPPR